MNIFEKIKFKLLRKNKKNDLIQESFSNFYQEQKLGKEYSDLGDVRTAMGIFAGSHFHLNKFLIYCKLSGKDGKQTFLELSKKEKERYNDTVRNL